jgi:hypothetical protein
MIIGIMKIINFLGVYTGLLFNMNDLFREAQSSIDPHKAPVFV